MLFADRVVVVRGGGDLGSGVAFRLNRAGFPTIVLERSRPAAIRRRVAFASAVLEGEIGIDGLLGRLVDYPGQAPEVAAGGVVAVVVAERLPGLEPTPYAVVDARMSKRNVDTRIDDAPVVVALGPGFVAGRDCDAVIETMRGHDLGRVIWEGAARPDTGSPGSLGGVDRDRVVRAPAAGAVSWRVEIGDPVEAGQKLGAVGESDVASKIGGVVRGLIVPGYPAQPGLKIADVDPRGDRHAAFSISDKARLVGGGALEAVMVRLGQDSVR